MALTGPEAGQNPTLHTYSLYEKHTGVPELPIIDDDEPILDVVAKLSTYLEASVDTVNSFEDLQTSPNDHLLSQLVSHLANNVHYPAVISALMILKWHYSNIEVDDGGIHDTRGYSCELVAWKFLTYLSQRERIEYLLTELPSPKPSRHSSTDIGTQYAFASHSAENHTMNEHTSLLHNEDNIEDCEDPTKDFEGLNTLEIAAIAGAKKLFSQKVVQDIVNSIWKGDIIFWETLSIHCKKKAKIYNKSKADPFCRLRVPRYQKIFEVLFNLSFLVLYYVVLVERNPRKLTVSEILLYIWIAAFAYDEFGEVTDAGILFYSADLWNFWDLGTVGVGIAFLVSRIIGLTKQSDHIIDIAFDILSLEALFLIPRVSSILSLHPYFGALIPCLKEMTKDFLKFIVIILVLYLGFLTTFTMLARDRLSLNAMSWILIKVFFGSSYLGFEVARDISPIFGPPLMLIFVSMTNILLITSLISLLSNTVTKVTEHSREEYLFQYSVSVLEASTSRRLVLFLPPLNLIPLLCIRPLRIFLPSEALRTSRIALLKATHAPWVAAIWVYESGKYSLFGDSFSRGSQPHRKPTGPATLLGRAARSRDVFAPALSGHSRLASDEAPESRNAQHGLTGQDAKSTADNSNVKVLAMLESLTLQVNELKLALSQQQQQQQQHEG